MLDFILSVVQEGRIDVSEALFSGSHLSDIVAETLSNQQAKQIE
jgi:hypothetical protein